MKSKSIFAVLLCLVFVSLSLLVPQVDQSTNTTAQYVNVMPAFTTHPPGITTLEAYQVKENVTAAQALQQISTEQLNTGQFVIQKMSQELALNTAQITTVQNADYTWKDSKAATTGNNEENLTIGANVIQNQNCGATQAISEGNLNGTYNQLVNNSVYVKQDAPNSNNFTVSLNDNVAAISAGSTSKFIRTNYVLRV